MLDSCDMIWIQMISMTINPPSKCHSRNRVDELWAQNQMINSRKSNHSSVEIVPLIRQDEIPLWIRMEQPHQTQLTALISFEILVLIWVMHTTRTLEHHRGASIWAEERPPPTCFPDHVRPSYHSTHFTLCHFKFSCKPDHKRFPLARSLSRRFLAG